VPTTIHYLAPILVLNTVFVTVVSLRSASIRKVLHRGSRRRAGSTERGGELDGSQLERKQFYETHSYSNPDVAAEPVDFSR